MTTKHPTKKEKDRLYALMEQLDYLFSINNFDRSITFKKTDHKGVAADISIDIPYQCITINIYPTFWTHTRKEQREFILHEYCHTVSRPLNDVACDLMDGKLITKIQRKDAWEEVTSRTAQLLDAQLRGRNKYAKIAYEKYLR